MQPNGRSEATASTPRSKTPLPLVSAKIRCEASRSLAGSPSPSQSSELGAREDLERAVAAVADLVREPQQRLARPRRSTSRSSCWIASVTRSGVSAAGPAASGRGGDVSDRGRRRSPPRPRARAAIRSLTRRALRVPPACARPSGTAAPHGRRRGPRDQLPTRSACARSTSSTPPTRPGRAATARRRSARRRPSSAPASRPPRTGSAPCAPSTSPRRGYPLKFAFGGAAKGPNPYINIINRLQVVQFEDFEGRAADARLRADRHRGPGGGALLRADDASRTGEWLAYNVLAKIWNHPDEALAKVGPAARGRRLRHLRPPARPGPALRARHHRADRGRAGAAAAAVSEREADRPAPRVGHVRLAAPDAVGLVRRRRDQGPDHRQRRPRRRRRRARQGRARWSGRPATPTATTRSASTRPTASGSRPRTASPPTAGTRTCRRSRASARRRSSSAAR